MSSTLPRDSGELCSDGRESSSRAFKLKRSIVRGGSRGRGVLPTMREGCLRKLHKNRDEFRSKLVGE